MAFEISAPPARNRSRCTRNLEEVVRARVTREPRLGGSEPCVCGGCGPAGIPVLPRPAERIEKESCVAHGPCHRAGCILTALIGTTPSVCSRPTVGSRPTQPLSELGQVIDPSVSVPTARGVRPPATAAPDPDDDPPALRSSTPWIAGEAAERRASRSSTAMSAMFRPHSERFVAPRTMSPASRRRSTSGASWLTIRSASANDPAEPGRPMASMLSLISTGRPCNGPRTRPAARSAWRPRRPRVASGQAPAPPKMLYSRPVERGDPVEQGARDRHRRRATGGEIVSELHCCRSGECCRGGVGVARADRLTLANLGRWGIECPRQARWSTPIGGSVNPERVSASSGSPVQDAATSTERDGAADAEDERYRLTPQVSQRKRGASAVAPLFGGTALPIRRGT